MFTQVTLTCLDLVKMMEGWNFAIPSHFSRAFSSCYPSLGVLLLPSQAPSLLLLPSRLPTLGSFPSIRHSNSIHWVLPVYYKLDYQDLSKGSHLTGTHKPQETDLRNGPNQGGNHCLEEGAQRTVYQGWEA